MTDDVPVKGAFSRVHQQRVRDVPRRKSRT
jgi:hypothetical protein